MADNKPIVAPKPPDTVEGISETISVKLTPVFKFAKDTYDRVLQQISSYDGVIEFTYLVITFLCAFLVAKRIRSLVDYLWTKFDGNRIFSIPLRTAVLRTSFALVVVILLWIGMAILRGLNINDDILRLVSSISIAWIFITIFASVVRDPFWNTFLAVSAWLVAILHILRLLNPTIAYLDGVQFSIGSSKISIYAILKGAAILIALVWLAIVFGRFVQVRLSNARTLAPSVQSLITQAARIGAVFVAVMIALDAIGVDLTALAVFSGAVGVGIGFGLQAIFSNLMSGVIMHLEGSVRVGDFVDLESGITGEVKEINTRATLITSNDNIDILVPNSQFINSRVTNWTLRQKFRRMRVPFGVAYGTDKNKVRTAVLEAAVTVPHELKGPNARPADVWLVGFGDSSLNFELVIWVNEEAVKRPASVRAEYNWAIETALGKHGIEIPFPQRDIHIRSGLVPIEKGSEKKNG